MVSLRFCKHCSGEIAETEGGDWVHVTRDPEDPTKVFGGPRECPETLAVPEGTKDSTLHDRAGSAVFERFPGDSWRVQPLAEVVKVTVNAAISGKPMKRVLELHAPFDDTDGKVICFHCSGERPRRALYPCPTVKAIYGEMG